MSEVKISYEARQLLAKEYDVGGKDGPYPSYAALARTGSGDFTLCSLRAIQKALDRGPGSDALAAQRDEGLAREAELRRRVSALEGDGSWGEMALTVKVERLQQHLAEAKRLLLDVRGQLFGPDQRTIDAFLASPACTNENKPE